MVAFFMLLLGQVAALPPHPLDEVIGKRKIEPAQVMERLSDSREWRDVVRNAVDKARKPAAKIGPTYPQRVRIAIANDLRNEKNDEGPDTKGEAKALPPHPLDKVIGDSDRPRVIIRALRNSKEFRQIVERAAKESTELRKDEAGATFGQQVRVKIADALLPPPDAAEKADKDAK